MVSSNRESRSGRDERWWLEIRKQPRRIMSPLQECQDWRRESAIDSDVPHESLLRPLEAGLPPVRNHSDLQSVTLGDRRIFATDTQACLRTRSAETGLREAEADQILFSRLHQRCRHPNVRPSCQHSAMNTLHGSATMAYDACSAGQHTEIRPHGIPRFCHRQPILPLTQAAGLDNDIPCSSGAVFARPQSPGTLLSDASAHQGRIPPEITMSISCSGALPCQSHNRRTMPPIPNGQTP